MHMLPVILFPIKSLLNQVVYLGVWTRKHWWRDEGEDLEGGYDAPSA